MIRYCVVDLETTSRIPEEARVVEWAYVIVEPEWFTEPVYRPHHSDSGLVNPGIPIPPETSAIHQIIDADVVNRPTWEYEKHYLLDVLCDPEVVAVAHSADTERTMLADLELPCRWLCTYKAALRVWPDAPSHSNEALRYMLGFGTGRSSEQHPHTALHDAKVTAQLLEALIQAGTSPQDMIQWTDEPAMLPRCPLGDWRGHPWAEVDDGFLMWILRKIHDREDVRFCAQHELNRREHERREESKALASLQSTSGLDSTLDTDIPF